MYVHLSYISNYVIHVDLLKRTIAPGGIQMYYQRLYSQKQNYSKNVIGSTYVLRIEQ